MKTYLIKKIFGPTIQGEGSKAGTAVKFIRFSGCNKWSGRDQDKAKSVCWYCDTDFYGGEKLTIEEIIEQLEALGPVKHVVLSGGEPMLQVDRALLNTLYSLNYRIHLETNGSKEVGDLFLYFHHITVSPKQGFNETAMLTATDLKVLFPFISSEITADSFKEFKAQNRFIQPLYTSRYDQNLLDAIEWVKNNQGWRLSLQTHKILGVE